MNSGTDPVSEIAWHLGPNGLFADCYEGLSLADYRTLSAVVREHTCCRECGMQSLVDTLGFTKGGVTRIVNRLESHGLLLRGRNPDDGRVCCALPTQQGHDLADRVSRRLEERLQSVLGDMPESEREALITLLTSFAGRLQNAAAAGSASSATAQ